MDLITGMKLYSKADEIFNGTKWVIEKNYPGGSMLVRNYWPGADILYNGIHYKNVLMNYDLLSNEMIIFNPVLGGEKYVVISKEKLEGFSFTDTVYKQRHEYIYAEIPGTRGKALYESIPAVNGLLLIRPRIQVVVRPSENIQGHVSRYSEYYLRTGNRYTSFQGRDQFFRLLETHVSDVRKFVRKNKLKINSGHPGDVVSAIVFLKGLK